MALAPLFQQKLEEAIQQGIQQGVQQGIQQGVQQGRQEGVQQGRQEGAQQGVQQGKRLIVENLLRVRFGEFSDRILPLVEPLSGLPSEDLTLLLLQFSQLSGDELGVEEVPRLVVEAFLKLRFGESDDDFARMVESLLALSSDELASLLLQLSQVSRDDFLARFGE
ncbi:hypothetical protein NJ959_22205 [Symplocastrum sp. BBK-W-15]|uniref:Flagellar assembly protein H n=1 Tax=Limnofasciculus baicalensis BBK-W-15 TaxID=2699891 RepID=A0AAE3GUZ4_9CYAN|nr:hypothetical protein [Limnofasciculus baicalensis BBK-W-15]